MAKKKNNKEKIVYYDDNSTIADMSSVTRDGKPRRPVAQKAPPTVSKWKTFWSAVKMMLVPTGIALTVLGLLYFFIMLISGNLF